MAPTTGLDPRVKLLWLAVVTFTAARSGAGGLIVSSVVVAGAVLWFKLRPENLARGLRPLLLLLSALLVVRAFSTPGEPLVSFGGMGPTREGLADGGRLCWRLGLIAAAGAVFAATTLPVEVRAALHWALRPLLRARAGRVATLLTLVLRFVAAIQDQARAVSLAQKARCADCRKNPFFRLRVFALPLLVKSLVSADRLALAMTARCYTDERTDPAFAFGPRDGVALAAAIVAAGAAVF